LLRVVAERVLLRVVAEGILLRVVAERVLLRVVAEGILLRVITEGILRILRAKGRILSATWTAKRALGRWLRSLLWGWLRRLTGRAFLVLWPREVRLIMLPKL
ncbi:MAG: hypothetical protein ACQESG_03595, partial [Nanobdellota archaeon]